MGFGGKVWAAHPVSLSTSAGLCVPWHYVTGWQRSCQPSMSTPFCKSGFFPEVCSMRDTCLKVVFDISQYLMALCAKLFQRHSQRQWITTCWICRRAVLVSWSQWVLWVCRHLAVVCFSAVNVQSRNLKHFSAVFPSGQKIFVLTCLCVSVDCCLCCQNASWLRAPALSPVPRRNQRHLVGTHKQLLFID